MLFPEDLPEERGLIEDLCLHGLLPELLPQGTGGLQLRTESLILERVPIKGK